MRLISTTLAALAVAGCAAQADRTSEVQRLEEHAEITLRMLIGFALRQDDPERYAAEFKQTNMIYNNAIARYIFDGEPMPTGTSERLRREKAEGSRVAIFLCEILNEVDPEHC